MLLLLGGGDEIWPDDNSIVAKYNDPNHLFPPILLLYIYSTVSSARSSEARISTVTTDAAYLPTYLHVSVGIPAYRLITDISASLL